MFSAIERDAPPMSGCATLMRRPVGQDHVAFASASLPIGRAADRCIRVAQDVGGVALLVDAKNDRIARWYKAMALCRCSMRRFRSCCRSPRPPTRSSAESSPVSAPPDFCNKKCRQNQLRSRSA
jgi:hypothetical protein